MGRDDVVIRAVGDDELQRLAPLVSALCAEEGKSGACIEPERLVSLLRDRAVAARALVAERAGEWLGYVVSYPVISLFKCEAVTLVENLYVLPAHRQLALGRRLLQAAAADSLRHGRRRLELNVRSDNAAACRFYERLGLVAVREEVRRIEDDALERLAAGRGEA